MSVNHKSLCLACSSSLPPSKSDFSRLFTTNCCQRPICPTCITSNPRLARYDPCLACLAGVNLLASTSNTSAPRTGSALKTPVLSPMMNLSGEVRDQDVFILGDEDENEDDQTDFNPRVEKIPSSNAVSGSAQAKEIDEKVAFELGSNLPSQQEEVTSMPAKYYLNRSDTLQGLSLRFGIDMHEIRKLNNLPSNIIRNPNLLHTRAFLILPPSAKPHPPLVPSKINGDETREAELVRERAVKKLQTLTKESDWRVAQAYVALADDEHEQEARISKVKEVSGSLDVVHTSSSSGTRLESLAVEKYLDDLEWEEEAIKAGRQPKLPKFPFGDFRSKESRVERGNRWPWGLG